MPWWPQVVFFGVFRMLDGEDKYTWVKNRLTDKEFDSGARVLAQFHHSAFAFDPGELAREQPPIMEFVPTLAATASKATAYTSRCKPCQRLAPSALITRLNDVAAKGVNNTNPPNPTRMKGRLAMSLAISATSKPMSNQL